MSDDEARRSAASGPPAEDPAPTELGAAHRTPTEDPSGTSGGAPGSGGSAAVKTPAHKGSGSFLRELPFLVVVAFGLALLIKTFLVQAFFIPSGSMEQTLAVQDRVLVNKVIYELRDIRRGEIVVFNGEG
ncbi:MAG: signal peptidase I, partial [Actinomycetota bacterium]|nr:signal peptidase I [Actinomycetota bacterium]